MSLSTVFPKIQLDASQSYIQNEISCFISDCIDVLTLLWRITAIGINTVLHEWLRPLLVFIIKVFHFLYTKHI